MRDYGRVHSAFWRSETVADMSSDARLLALYLMTCDHGNLLGAFYLPDGYAAEDLNWGSDRVSEGFRELLRVGFAVRCAASKWVWVVRYLDWNPLENPNQVKAAQRIAAQIPGRCQWLRVFHSQLAEALGLPPIQATTPIRTLLEPLSKGSETLSEQGEGTGEGKGAVSGAGEVEDSASLRSAAADGGAGKPTQAELTKRELWEAGKSLLAEQGMKPAQCGSFVGKLVKDYGDEVVVEAVRSAVLTRPADAAEFLVGACKAKSKPRNLSKQAMAEEQAKASEREWLEQQGIAQGAAR